MHKADIYILKGALVLVFTFLIMWEVFASCGLFRDVGYGIGGIVVFVCSLVVISIGGMTHIAYTQFKKDIDREEGGVDL